VKTVPIQPLPRSTAVAAGPWRFAHLMNAPHRLAFAAGAAMLAGTALWWAFALIARQAAFTLPWAVSPATAHGLVMALGFMPFFITGFAFTAGPRWLGLPEVSTRVLRAPLSSMLAGWAVALLGFHVAAPLAAAGMATVALGWSAVVHRFVGLLRASSAPDKLHPRLLAATAALGALALWAAAAALALSDDTALRAATRLALWGFLVPLFVTVAHRMLPFFTASALPLQRAWRPNALLWAMLVAPLAELPFALAELWWWPLPPAARWAQAAIELPAALLLLWLAVHWGLVQSLKIRLLAMLHVGFLWLGLSFALGAVSHAMMAWHGPEHSLGLAPLHALTMGYLGSTLLAMATRVTAGHSGRPLAADDIAWVLFWVLQIAVLLRLAGALWPAAAAPLLLAAAAAWAVAMSGWALRYGRWLGRPRADGRPG
jgi:uncharacterized protein involved in response to NO